jgi:hypothetical protein
MLYEDGSFYEGNWLDNLRHGLGRLILNNGDCYEGEFSENK